MNIPEKTLTKGDLIVQDISKGTIFYEYAYGQKIRCTALEDPKWTKNVEDEYGNWSFKALAEDGTEIDYLITHGMSHYGPALYKDSRSHKTSSKVTDAITNLVYNWLDIAKTVKANGIGTLKNENPKTYDFYICMIEEEFKELKDSTDTVNRAKELGDLLWVVLQGFYMENIDPFRVVEEIHRSNMSKFMTSHQAAMDVSLYSLGEHPMKPGQVIPCQLDHTGEHYIIRRAEDWKIMKPRTYEPADIGAFIPLVFDENKGSLEGLKPGKYVDPFIISLGLRQPLDDTKEFQWEGNPYPYYEAVTLFLNKFGLSDNVVAGRINVDRKDAGFSEMAINSGYLWLEQYNLWIYKDHPELDNEAHKILSSIRLDTPEFNPAIYEDNGDLEKFKQDVILRLTSKHHKVVETSFYQQAVANGDMDAAILAFYQRGKAVNYTARLIAGLCNDMMERINSIKDEEE